MFCCASRSQVVASELQPCRASQSPTCCQIAQPSRTSAWGSAQGPGPAGISWCGAALGLLALATGAGVWSCTVGSSIQSLCFTKFNGPRADDLTTLEPQRCPKRPLKRSLAICYMEILTD